MTRHRRRLPFGAELSSRDTAMFSLYAPDVETVTLELDGADVAMRGDESGLFSVTANARDGSRYRFRLPDGKSVPDPAARAQDGGIEGASIVVDPRRYAWRNDDWCGRSWHRSVIYELHAGLLGGFDGVRARLPELADLGVTSVQLMPIAQFPGQRNWGYDGVLPFAPAAAYGTPDQLKRLVDDAHGLGLSMLLDVVYNHFGPLGNHLPAYASTFFRQDVVTPWGPAIDFREPFVRRFFIENALYWLQEFRFDGLRLDAVHAITERDWLVELARRVRQACGGGRIVHLVVENENNDASLLASGFDAQWNDDAHHVLHVLLTGECEGYYGDFAHDITSKLARWLGEGFVYQGEATRVSGKPRGQSSAQLVPSAFINCLQNHDQIGNRAFGDRLVDTADPRALRVATALLLLCPQIPMLFMGEEHGASTPFQFFTDYTGELATAVREGRRKEFATFSAFTDPGRREDIPDPNDPATFQRSVPYRGHQHSAHSRWMAGILRLRREWITPRLAGSVAAGVAALGTGAVQARWRLADGTLLLINVNLGAEDVELAADSGVPDDGSVGERSALFSYEWPAEAFESESANRLPARSIQVRLTRPCVLSRAECEEPSSAPGVDEVPVGGH